MRLRYLELDFFEQESRAAARRCERSIIHTCALRLPEIPHELHDAAPIPELIHQIGEKPLHQVNPGPEPEPRVRDRLLRSLLPFKQVRDEFPRDNAEAEQLEHHLEEEPPRILFPYLEPFQILDENLGEELPQVWDSAGFHQNLEQPIIETLGLMRVKLQQFLIPCKLEYVENAPQKLAEVLTRPPEFLSLEEPVIIPDDELKPERELELDPGKLAEILAVEAGDMQPPESLSFFPEELENELLSNVFLRKEELPTFPELGFAEALEKSVENSAECFEMEPVMVSEEALTLLWDPGSLARALELKPVELERLENSTGAELLEKLVVAPELSLGCNFFKFLPVPGVGEWGEKLEPVAEVVIGILLANTRSSQPSATDFIYLDWHYSQGNSCNDQRCFQLRIHRLCDAPERIENVSLNPVEHVSPEPSAAAAAAAGRVSGSGAFVSLEILPGDHEGSSGRLVDANAGEKNVSSRAGVGTGDRSFHLDDAFRRQGSFSGDAFPGADDSRRPGEGFRPRSRLEAIEAHRRSKLGAAFPRADDHRRQDNAFFRSGMELDDGDHRRHEAGLPLPRSAVKLVDDSPQASDHHCGLKLDDAFPKADDHRREEGGFPCSIVKAVDVLLDADDHRPQANAFVCSELPEAGHQRRQGVKLADAFPKFGDNRRQFLRSELELDDVFPKADDHRREQGGFPRSGVKQATVLPKSDDHRCQNLSSGLQLDDGFRRADDRRRSGVKPADVLPKADDHRRQENTFLRSELALGDGFPNADDHRRRQEGVVRVGPRHDVFLHSGVELDDASPRADDHRRQNSHSQAKTFDDHHERENVSPPSTTCTAIFVANMSRVNKHGLTSRRSSYQKVLSFEKKGAQVIERELRLPIDLILNPKECLVFYTPERLGLQGQAWSSEAVSSCIGGIIDNEMKAISFGFQVCFMVFEGDRRFISAVLEDLDTIYVAAVGLNIHAQCFVASSPGETDEVVHRCLKQAERSYSAAGVAALPRMAESQTVAEAFLTQSPAINPLAAHAILSPCKPLSRFIAMATAEQLETCRPFGVCERSLELFKAQCEYGRVQRRAEPARRKQAQAQRREEIHLSSQKSSENLPGVPLRQQAVSVFPTQSTSRRVFHRGDFEVEEEVQGPGKQGGGDFSREKLGEEKLELELGLSGPYFPPAAELEWSPEMSFNPAAPCFPPATQLDEVWDESPTVGEPGAFLPAFDYENFNNNKENINDNNNNEENNTCEFGFSSNRRQSSSSSSVQDALRSWLSTRETNKQSSKKPANEGLGRSTAAQAQAFDFNVRKREAPAAAALVEQGSNKASKKKQQKQQKNDILSLWENFKCRKQAQIQASGSLLQTSRSFKRPSSSIFSSSSSSPPHNPPSRQMQSLSSVQQQPRGGKRAKRVTL